MYKEYEKTAIGVFGGLWVFCVLGVFGDFGVFGVLGCFGVWRF